MHNIYIITPTHIETKKIHAMELGRALSQVKGRTSVISRDTAERIVKNGKHRFKALIPTVDMSFGPEVVYLAVK